MCCLIVEILMLVNGVYTLVAGKLYLTQHLYLEGHRARVAGLFLIAPLPLVLFSGVVIGILVGMGVLSESSVSMIGLVVEFLLVLSGLGGMVVFARAMMRRP